MILTLGRPCASCSERQRMKALNTAFEVEYAGLVADRTRERYEWVLEILSTAAYNEVHRQNEELTHAR